ncbi:unnamed protein product, partial [Hapterophycus canaliculatus]
VVVIVVISYVVEHFVAREKNSIRRCLPFVQLKCFRGDRAAKIPREVWRYVRGVVWGPLVSSRSSFFSISETRPRPCVSFCWVSCAGKLALGSTGLGTSHDRPCVYNILRRCSPWSALMMRSTTRSRRSRSSALLREGPSARRVR